jgi:outer membrane protein OmpA-like peptidoglycan-associated protein
MSRFKIIFILLLLSSSLFSQTREILHVKSFYYDVDNFSLTAESMIVLKDFVNEVKTKPIEIIEIIGYVEKTGSPVYNQIRSKKRMNSIKGSIDSAIIIHQYRPENLDYPPAFLYSYSDGFNWRRVDIKYRYKEPVIVLPTKDYQSEDPFYTKTVEPEINTPDEKPDIYTKTIQLETELTEIKNEPISSDNDSIDYKQVEEVFVKTELDLKPLDKKEKISIEGKSQEEIDKIVVLEKSAKQRKPNTQLHPDLGSRLSKIKIEDLEKSIILLSMNLQFEGDQPIITPSSLAEMNDLFYFLSKNNAVDAFIRGHVCCGDEMPLSKKRAKLVYTELVDRGINAERLRCQGFSNTLLLVQPELTEYDRSRNRRVDIIFSKNNLRSNDPVIVNNKPKIDSTTFIDTVVTVFKPNQPLQILMEEDGNTELSTSGKSQDQIDNLLVRERASKFTRYKRYSDMEKKLNTINIQNLNNSVALVIMGLEFEGTDPIINDSSIKEMNDLFNFLNQNKEVNAFIRGHVCCGNDVKLSKKRAKYVYTELVKKGIDYNRLRYQGFSNNLLLVSPEKTDADREKNRRVDIIFSIKSKTE